MAAESTAQAVMCTRSPRLDYNDKDSRKKKPSLGSLSELFDERQPIKIQSISSIIVIFSFKNVAGVFLILVSVPEPITIIFGATKPRKLLWHKMEWEEQFTYNEVFVQPRNLLFSFD